MSFLDKITSRFHLQEKMVLNQKNLRCDIYRDRETGVNYIVSSTGSITPLLGKDGKPVITNEP